MATFLDIGLISHFKVIFTVLLVFVIVFAMLEKSGILGKNKGLHSLVALCVAMMLLFVPGVVEVVALLAPWFVLLILTVFLFMLLLMSFGVGWDKIAKFASGDRTLIWVVIVIGIVVFMGALSQVYGDKLLPYTGETGGDISTSVTGNETATDTGEFDQNVGRVIFHPKTLGAVLILVIGALTIKLMSGMTKGG